MPEPINCAVSQPSQITPAGVSIGTIAAEECIGSSLTRINENFANLKAFVEATRSAVNTWPAPIYNDLACIQSFIDANLILVPLGGIMMYGVPENPQYEIYEYPSNNPVSTPSAIRDKINTDGLQLILDIVRETENDHWQVCNGAEWVTTAGNYTPDLRGRFITSYGTATDISGASSATWTPQVGAVPSPDTRGKHDHRLTIGQMPEHQHDGTSGGGDTVVNGGSLRMGTRKISGKGTYWKKGSAATVSLAPQGGNEFHPNIPPYYSLIFIQRVS